jgi:hypothetical protein
MVGSHPEQLIEMLNGIVIIMAVAFFMKFLSTKCCIYTAIIAHLLLSALGLSSVYCVGYVQEVDGKNHYHAWVWIGSYDIEQSTLNLQHYDAVNYSKPDVTFDTTSSFINRMDMWSPIRWLV